MDFIYIWHDGRYTCRTIIVAPACSMARYRDPVLSVHLVIRPFHYFGYQVYVLEGHYKVTLIKFKATFI